MTDKFQNGPDLELGQRHLGAVRLLALVVTCKLFLRGVILLITRAGSSQSSIQEGTIGMY